MNTYQTFMDLENIDIMDSGLSFSEQVIHSSYLTEKAIRKRELKPPSYYKGRMFEIRENMKQEIEKGKDPEEAIKHFIKSIYRKKFDLYVLPTEAIEKDRTNCVSSTALFLSLAEMLDYNLFEKCSVGYFSEKEEKVGHVFVRKETGKEHENIDHGKSFPDNNYTIKYGKLPIIKPRKFIIAQILNSIGTSPFVNEEEKIKFFDKAIKIHKESSDIWNNKGNAFCILGQYEEGIKCFDESLRIEPGNFVAQANRETAFKCLDII